MKVSISRKDLLMNSLDIFFSKPENIIRIVPIIAGFNNISLRIIDWFVTNYSKKNNTSYIIDGRDNTLLMDMLNYEPIYCKEFIVYLDYKLQLKAYSKKQFDPFCRRSRIDYRYNKHDVLQHLSSLTMDDNNIKLIDFFKNHSGSFVTTVGQLNFFKWILNSNIVEYIMQHLKVIETDMNNCYKKQYSNKNTKGRKKRHELSVSATKSLNRSNVKVVVSFN